MLIELFFFLLLLFFVILFKEFSAIVYCFYFYFNDYINFNINNYYYNNNNKLKRFLNTRLNISFISLIRALTYSTKKSRILRDIAINLLKESLISISCRDLV